MDEDVKRADPLSGPSPELDQTEARQGVTGHNVRYVLLVGLTIAAIGGIIVYATVGN